jgi:ribosomal protein L11
MELELAETDKHIPIYLKPNSQPETKITLRQLIKVAQLKMSSSSQSEMDLDQE